MNIVEGLFVLAAILLMFFASINMLGSTDYVTDSYRFSERIENVNQRVNYQETHSTEKTDNADINGVFSIRGFFN